MTMLTETRAGESPSKENISNTNSVQLATQGKLVQGNTNPAVKASKPAELQKGPLRFVITDSPTEATVKDHAKALIKLNVKHVCRATDPTYSTETLNKYGIQVHELSFKDGDPPPEIVLEKWLDLVEQCFIKSNKKKKASSSTAVQPLKDNEKISVHCVAGLGRAPVLVAVALVEYCNLEPQEAVKLIRAERRGAFNTKQLKWLEKYTPTRQGLLQGCNCVVS